MKRIFTFMFIASGLFVFIMIFTVYDAKAISIQTVENVKDECPTLSSLTSGCYQFGGGIYLREDLSPSALVRILMHELGHYFTQSEDQRVADYYGDYLIESQMEIVINKPYIKYYGSGDVYRYATGEKITYEYALKNNIWNMVQDLPFRKKLIPLSLLEKFSKQQ